MNLNKQIRQTIIDRAITQKFGPLFDAHNQALRQLGDRIYQAMLGEYESQMRAMPKGFFLEESWIQLDSELFSAGEGGLCCEFKLPGRDIDPCRSGYGRNSFCRWRGIKLTSEHPFPKFFKYDIKKHPDLVKEVEIMIKTQQALLSDLRSVEEDMRQVLESCRTKVTLLAVWPEIEPLIPEPVTKTQLPIPHDIPQRLTSILGLPPVAAVGS